MNWAGFEPWPMGFMDTVPNLPFRVLETAQDSGRGTVL